MGQEIAEAHFTQQDFVEFTARLREETALLKHWLASDRFETAEPTAGFELETWLVDPRLDPAPEVESLLAGLNDPLVVAELATFNAEINGSPLPLTGNCLSRFATELTATLQRCDRVAQTLGTRLLTIGILPTVRPQHLSLGAMTPRQRYRALNDQIFALRHDRPLKLEIAGRDRLTLEWHDVMLEAAATSFQIHLKVTPGEAARVYNASKIISGPMVAIAANSPYLFGHDLWDETRIPLFEQAVSPGGPILQERVSFGFRYAERSIMETFRANLDRYPVLLPHLMDEEPQALAHLRLHNGTIWRWNRPLLGFDAARRPHLRIEHRVVPAGPTVSDMVANAALYLGAVRDLAGQSEPLESRIPFLQTRAAFYACAREGLDAEIPWLDGAILPVARVLREDLLPRARRGLLAAGIDPPEIAHWLGIVERRLETRRTGARWQRAWVARHGPDMAGLTAAYLEQQDTGRPVHEWTLLG
ncbi:glutamate--cysteine ligase [Thiocapsa rosea]|uniref:Gamma-glutamyl:cysteine ligase YbdK (ATP-grasp superfamily) n=1 Tax=Thiocapsa rosea TaxID=69360 RepID=A0A495V6D9_9GAMM|nr:glutamate--cysteine ligase [Thiocapsa rosea]RKT43368.1 gamma-glutamyl:cysteine ligase YbdK (ATP-grasp superfamily) [Thiocapsa rosea]